MPVPITPQSFWATIQAEAAAIAAGADPADLRVVGKILVRGLELIKGPIEGAAPNIFVRSAEEFVFSQAEHLIETRTGYDPSAAPAATL